VTTAITCQNESLFSCDAIDGSSILHPQKSSRFTLQRIIAQVQVIGFRCCRRVRMEGIGKIAERLCGAMPDSAFRPYSLQLTTRMRQ